MEIYLMALVTGFGAVSDAAGGAVPLHHNTPEY